MSWGVDLWDGYEHICTHTEHGIEFVKRTASFVEKLIHVEQNYAKELRKLCKQYKKKEEESSKYSSVRCFAKLVTETNDLAGQKELVAEYWQAEVLDEMKVVVKDITAERKTHMFEGAKRINELKLTMEQLDKAKKHYERTSEEAENAQHALEKADSDPNSTKAKIDKLTQILRAKEAAAEESKNNYILQLENTNLKRRLHFNSEMPHVFQNLQEMNAKRVEKYSSLVSQCAECNRRVFPVVNTCLDNITHTAAAVDSRKDNQQLIQEKKTGYPIPGDEDFQQYGPKKISRRNRKKKIEPQPDFSHLAPEPRKKKLITKVNDFESQVAKATADKKAMEKMQSVYKENPQLGDPNSLGQSLEQTSIKIAGLVEERDKYQAWLQEAQESLSAVTKGQGGASPRPSPKNKKKNEKSDPVPTQKSTTPVAPQPAPVASPPDANESFSDPDEEDEEDEDEEEDGREGVVIYDFNPQTEDELTVLANDKVMIIQDLGDGWLRVRKGHDEGYIPGSYVNISG